MNGIVFFFISVAFICATIATTNNVKHIKQDLLDQLTEKEKEIYAEIVEERKMIYYQGLLLGDFIATIYILFTFDNDIYRTLFVSIGLTFIVNYFYYILMPKSKYMLEYLDSPNENKAWLKIYRFMQVRYHAAFLYGLIASAFMYYYFLSFKK